MRFIIILQPITVCNFSIFIYWTLHVRNTGVSLNENPTKNFEIRVGVINQPINLFFIWKTNVHFHLPLIFSFLQNASRYALLMLSNNLRLFLISSNIHFLWEFAGWIIHKHHQLCYQELSIITPCCHRLCANM